MMACSVTAVTLPLSPTWEGYAFARGRVLGARRAIALATLFLAFPPFGAGDDCGGCRRRSLGAPSGGGRTGFRASDRGLAAISSARAGAVFGLAGVPVGGGRAAPAGPPSRHALGLGVVGRFVRNILPA
jgi:hypothetical protein